MRPTATTRRIGRTRLLAAALALALGAALAAGAFGWTEPERARRGMVVSQSVLASRAGLDVLKEGGSAIDAAVATAFVLAVTLPEAGNIGGGGFLVYRPMKGEPVAYDFRERAPAAAHVEMFLEDGEYSNERHQKSHVAVGVPGTVAGLHAAWEDHGRLPWKRLARPAAEIARKGFKVSARQERSFEEHREKMEPYPASIAAYTDGGKPYRAGDRLRLPDLARTLTRIAKNGRDEFYRGETARLLAAEMARGGGLITMEDLAAYEAVRRAPVRGTYRGHEILGMPPPSSGGMAVVQALNVLEGFDLAAMGAGSADHVHLVAEATRRAFAERARFLGDPDFNPEMPLARLISKEHAAALRATIEPAKASVSSPAEFAWPPAGGETTHLSVVDADRNAVALTYTLEQNYGSGIVVPGAGFLLNNEMGDFNPVPGETNARGRIGTDANLAAPGKRMLSSMSPTIVAKDGSPRIVAGAAGGRTIISTTLQIVIDVIDFGMNAQAAVDAPRFHHQWLPDVILYERHGLSPDTLEILKARGHAFEIRDEKRGDPYMGVAGAIVVDAEDGWLEGASDRREPGGAALGY